MTAKKRTYREMKQELQKVLDWFETNQGDDLDEILEKYNHANALLTELEMYLNTVSASVEKQKKT